MPSVAFLTEKNFSEKNLLALEREHPFLWDYLFIRRVTIISMWSPLEVYIHSPSEEWVNFQGRHLFLPSKSGSSLKGNNLFLKEQILSCKSRVSPPHPPTHTQTHPVKQASSSRKFSRMSWNLFPWKWQKTYGDISVYLKDRFCAIKCILLQCLIWNFAHLLLPWKYAWRFIWRSKIYFQKNCRLQTYTLAVVSTDIG